MEPNCEFSAVKPRFGSIKVKIPRMQPFVAEKKEEEGKVMKVEEEEEEDDEGGMSMDLVEEKKHICCECGKGFKSGKALGGHKRIHGFEARKFSMVMSRPKMLYGRSEKGEVEVACCVCDKKFTSMKALYGHMRFHPDRGWKGVLPPPPLPLSVLGNSSSSTLSNDDHDDEFISSDYDDDEEDDENSELWNNNWELENVVDLKDSLKGWSVKGKRGRRSVDVKEEEANQLLLLADILENDAYTTHPVVEKRKKKKKRLSEMEKEAAAPTSHDLVENHVCVTCNKSFTSYQALGGHRASHNKGKLGENVQVRANGEALLLGTEAIIASAQGSNTSLSSSGDHICNSCHKIPSRSSSWRSQEMPLGWSCFY